MPDTSQTPDLPGLEDTGGGGAWVPDRATGLARLSGFAPRAAKAYAARRNYDFGPGRHDSVSTLSPWIRHRLITEEEVLRATLARHSPASAEKFVQEVFWRGYFKGWLEQRPTVWDSYQQGLRAALDRAEADQTLRADYVAATQGATGIDAFDHWADELTQTGYLHNHARMWFASIWIFTLRLPWELGADFFLRHLMDGDPAANTLSWRWVGGLHTRGKTYQARASNIAKYTDGRFHPGHALAHEAPPLSETIEHPLRPLPPADAMPDGDCLLLLTEEDCTIDHILPRPPLACLGLMATGARSALRPGEAARGFAIGAVRDGVARAGADHGIPATMGDGDWAEAIAGAAHAAQVRDVVTGYAPVGPVAERLRDIAPALQAQGLTLHQIRRPYDDLAWPHATRGFFALKKKIPAILRDLNLSA